MSAEANLARFVARTLDNAEATARSKRGSISSITAAATAAVWRPATAA